MSRHVTRVNAHIICLYVIEIARLNGYLVVFYLKQDIIITTIMAITNKNTYVAELHLERIHVEHGHSQWRYARNRRRLQSREEGAVFSG